MKDSMNPFHRMIRFSWLSLAVVHMIIANPTSPPGKAHSTVQSITAKNWDKMVLQDPANGLWLLKFYGTLKLFNSIYGLFSKHVELNK